MATMDSVQPQKTPTTDAGNISLSDIENQMAAIDRQANIDNKRNTVVAGSLYTEEPTTQPTKSSFGMSEFEDLLASLDAPKPMSPPSAALGLTRSVPAWKAGATPAPPSPQDRRNTMAEIDNILSSLSQSMDDLSDPGSSQSMSGLLYSFS